MWDTRYTLANQENHDGGFMMFKIEQKKRESGKNKEKIWLQTRARNEIFLHETYASTRKNLRVWVGGGA